MILIVEAGGTKSNLALVNKMGIQSTYVDAGLQLTREPLEEIRRKIERWVDLFQEPVNTVWLFAAGATINDKTAQVKNIIQHTFKCDTVFIESDLMGACYATAGVGSGIVGILGTGSNSCFYNGQSIVHQVSPGGFMLGDEGSGAHIGKVFLRDFLRNQVPLELMERAADKLGLNSTTIVQQLYGGSIRDSANYCAISGGFVLDNLDNEYCKEISEQCIHEFLDLIESNYLSYTRDLHLVGSVAYLLKESITRGTIKRNINLIKIIQHPIHELSLFLSRKEYS